MVTTWFVSSHHALANVFFAQATRCHFLATDREGEFILLLFLYYFQSSFCSLRCFHHQLKNAFKPITFDCDERILLGSKCHVKLIIELMWDMGNAECSNGWEGEVELLKVECDGLGELH